MAAVGGGQQVLRMQVGAHARRHSFLACGQMQGAAHLGTAIGGFVVGAHPPLADDFGRVFKSANAAHAAVELAQRVNIWVGRQVHSFAVRGTVHILSRYPE